ncbi:MAG TPA: VOC family protein [Candidatus Limnocylindrales bacterium]|nr:VOC family protein [Candidatus Limnocylindrales bacterium]
MRELRLDHVACGVRSSREIAALLECGLGARPHRGGPGAGFDGRQWSFAGGGLLELIEPSGDPDGFLHRFIAARGPGVHHVTFKVPDIHDARDRAVRLGYDVVGFNDEQPSWKECFLHPKQAGGIVVQMAEVDPDYQSDDWQPFAASYEGAPRSIATLKGPRLVIRERERAHRCWVELLGASVEKSGDSEETFRWQGCPLVIRVVIDPSAKSEGPTALEFAPFECAFPEPLPALLGSPLIQN